MKSIFKKAGKAAMWFFIVIFSAFVILTVVRMFHFYNLKKTVAEVEKIHNTKLAMDDVTGKNLPPDPRAETDKTIAGIDANKNGIRDDVELAIFKEYPNSAKTRAALLQYALVLQMQMTLPILNRETVTATVEDNESRARICFWNLSSRSDMKKFLADMDKYRNFVEQRQINTKDRKKYQHDFYEHLGSFSASRESCDLNFSALTN